MNTKILQRMIIASAFSVAIVWPGATPSAMMMGMNTATRAGMPSRSMTLGDLSFSVYPRIFTPNGDGRNDKAGFHFVNPEDLPVQGEVFELSGAKVADLKPGTDPTLLLTWDGKDNDGRTVPAGLYLYQIEFQGKHATGTIAVAR